MIELKDVTIEDLNGKIIKQVTIDYDCLYIVCTDNSFYGVRFDYYDSMNSYQRYFNSLDKVILKKLGCMTQEEFDLLSKKEKESSQNILKQERFKKYQELKQEFEPQKE